MGWSSPKKYVMGWSFLKSAHREKKRVLKFCTKQFKTDLQGSGKKNLLIWKRKIRVSATAKFLLFVKKPIALIHVIAFSRDSMWKHPLDPGGLVSRAFSAWSFFSSPFELVQVQPTPNRVLLTLDMLIFLSGLISKARMPIIV